MPLKTPRDKIVAMLPYSTVCIASLLAIPLRFGNPGAVFVGERESVSLSPDFSVNTVWSSSGGICNKGT